MVGLGVFSTVAEHFPKFSAASAGILATLQEELERRITTGLWDSAADSQKLCHFYKTFQSANICAQAVVYLILIWREILKISFKSDSKLLFRRRREILFARLLNYCWRQLNPFPRHVKKTSVLVRGSFRKFFLPVSTTPLRDVSPSQNG